jgi:uncharacterized repeat protein (TIGR01451 family)
MSSFENGRSAMKVWLRSARGVCGLILAGWIVALVVAVSWGQVVPGETTSFGEPPMIEPPLSPQPPASPNPPFTPPPPTPLPPEQAAPFAPAPPFAAANPMGPPPPVVQLRVRAPARVGPDKEIEYRLTVENVSSAAAHHVLIRDRLPRSIEENIRAEPKATEQKKTKEGDTDLLWELGTLKPGEQKVIVLAVKPKGNEDVQNRAYVQFEHGQKVTTHIAKPSVRVKATAPSQAIRYEAVSFRIEVANTGAAPLRNVVVTDELPAGLVFVSGKPEPNTEKPLTWKLGDVPPHQVRRLEYQAISQQTGTFRNNAKVTAAGGVSATDSAGVTVGEAKLKISISGPSRRLVNRPIPYHITIGNLGSVPLSNVQVSDELPPEGVEFVSASSGGRREGGFVRWSLGSLKPGELRSLLLVLRAPKSGKELRDMVRATAICPHAEGGSEEISDKAISEEARIELPTNTPVIEIDKNTDWLVVGQKATYTIRLLNPGKNNVLHPSVFVEVPDKMNITAVRGESTGRQQGQKVHFDPVSVLGAGEEKAYTIEVEAKKAGEAKLRAWWTDGRHENGLTETWEDKTIILDPSQIANAASSQEHYIFGVQMQPHLSHGTWSDAPITVR